MRAVFCIQAVLILGLNVLVLQIEGIQYNFCANLKSIVIMISLRVQEYVSDLVNQNTVQQRGGVEGILLFRSTRRTLLMWF